MLQSEPPTPPSHVDADRRAEDDLLIGMNRIGMNSSVGARPGEDVLGRTGQSYIVRHSTAQYKCRYSTSGVGASKRFRPRRVLESAQARLRGSCALIRYRYICTYTIYLYLLLIMLFNITVSVSVPTAQCSYSILYRCICTCTVPPLDVDSDQIPTTRRQTLDRTVPQHSMYQYNTHNPCRSLSPP